MDLRKTLLRVLFGSLAAAALLGAGGVLMAANNDAVWRIAGTCMLTAGAALCLLGASWVGDKSKSETVIAASATLIVIEYLLGLSMIWDLWGWPMEGKIIGTMLALAGCGLPAVAFLHGLRFPIARWASRLGLILSGAVFVLFELGLFYTWHGRLSEDLMETSAALAGFGLLAIMSMFGAGTDRRHWRWGGVAASATGFAIMAYAILFHVHGDSGVFVTIVSIAALFAQANILYLVPLPRGQQWLLWITLLAGAGTAVCVDILQFVSRHEAAYDLLLRIASACGILTGCGTIALGILARINRRIEIPEAAVSGITEITLICPICKKKQTAAIGESRCSACGVIFKLHVEEPRCPACNYSLLMLTSDRCPECGSDVRLLRAGITQASSPLPAE